LFASVPLCSVAKPLSDKYIGLGPHPQELHNIANIAVGWAASRLTGVWVCSGT
jgi:hypothetical protein